MMRAACLLAAGLAWGLMVGSSSAFAGEAPAMDLIVLDPAVSGRPATAAADVADPALRAFVEALSERLARRLEARGARPGASRLTVLRIPLVTSGDAPFPLPPAPAEAGEADCRAVSPWAEAAVRRDGSGPAVELFATWNERRILRDQAEAAAMDAGAAPLPPAPEPLLPLSRTAFADLADAYAREVLMGEAPAAGDPPLAERLPPDLAWLFERAPQSTRGPFDLGAEADLAERLPRFADDYAALIDALVDRCLAPGGTGGRFDGLRDARALAGPEFATPDR
ncbi:hypothetical protein P2H44_04140 [Albimonas sp. CAU 1670]|uniref:hypothetical protein n=1 Tax=Albimonas sp. CAU 1670 TaxID=3032599 RepID=UPI0023DBDD1F|nr:hypothetical protein [Albimonas sp. CAU 1670]MDF2231733.1 hypothetical protein [Albimonas sp. CAU 1670]